MNRAPAAALGIGAIVALIVVLPLGAAAGGAASSPGGHYLARTGDGFHYAETVVVNDGTGNYTGYTETTFTNGSIAVTGTAPNGTDAASFAYAYHYVNNQGADSNGGDQGTFTFSAVDFQYVNGTDNQTGYSAPIYLWFYLNNSLGVNGRAVLLNTPVTVQSTNTSYGLPFQPGRYVAAISVSGSGSYQRNDAYGVFTATYTWQAYFDPGTGFIVGYLYTEHDSDSAGNGFTWTDTLGVTSTTYPLTNVPAPPSPPASGGSLPVGLIVGVIVLVVVVVVVVAIVAARRSAKGKLPTHSPTGRVAYGSVGAGPPPVPPGAGPAPGPVHLVPGDQPMVQQVVVRETVKVPCAYCGTLMDSTAKVCPQCGAPRN